MDVSGLAVTEAMLAPIREVADGSRLPQTVWPSRWGLALGADCALLSVAFVFGDGDGPEDKAPGSSPILSVLPAGYFAGW